MSENTPQSRISLSFLAMAAIVGQVVLLASALLLPFVSEFRFVGDTMSELVLGRFGWIQTAAFVVAGAGTLALAYAIRQLTAGTWGSRVGSLLVGIYGVGAILIAIFPTDRIDSAADMASLSTAGLIHVAVSLVSFVCMIAAMFILTRTFAKDSRWRSSLPFWIVLLPASALSLLFVQSEGPWVGIMQRLMVGAITAWIIIVAVRVRAMAASAVPGPSEQKLYSGSPQRI
jgi:hypothetical protein